ncbi:Basic proline-rich protein precursor [Pseudonocardia sp. Ae356_Ps1]|nr:Basic proline-rich protein precursor [Pseudonocardia sp. Ae356_Ps1]
MRSTRRSSINSARKPISLCIREPAEPAETRAPGTTGSGSSAARTAESPTHAPGAIAARADAASIAAHSDSENDTVVACGRPPSARERRVRVIEDPSPRVGAAPAGPAVTDRDPPGPTPTISHASSPPVFSLGKHLTCSAGGGSAACSTATRISTHSPRSASENPRRNRPPPDQADTRYHQRHEAERGDTGQDPRTHSSPRSPPRTHATHHRTRRTRRRRRHRPRTRRHRPTAMARRTNRLRPRLPRSPRRRLEPHRTPRHRLRPPPRRHSTTRHPTPHNTRHRRGEQ